MAWVSTKEVHRGREFHGGEKFVRSYKRSWLIQTDNKNDNVTYVANNSGLPLPYSSYPDDIYALRLGLDVVPAGDESGILWEASAMYSTQYDTQQQNNPLQRPPLYVATGSTYTQIIAKDIQNKVILNFSGDYYDPPPEINAPRGGIKVTVNKGDLPSILADISTYVGAVNGDSWQSNNPRTWLCMSIESGQLQVENGIPFYAVTYEFHFRRETWDANLLEIGYNGLSGGKKCKFKSDVPQLLKKVDASSVRRQTDPTQASFTAWRVYPEASFSALGF